MFIEQTYIDKMKKILETNAGDSEAIHSGFDNILCEILLAISFDEVVELYNSVEKHCS